jgi:hypothetical protein
MLVILFLVLVYSFVSIAFGANSNSVDFESGSNQYLSISDGSQTGLDMVSNNFTIEAWVKLESLPTGTSDAMNIVSKWGGTDTGGGRNYKFLYDKVGSNYRLNLALSSTGNSADFVELLKYYSLNTGTWYHLAVTYNLSTGIAEFFLNGASLGTATGGPTTLTNGSTEFNIGREPANGQYMDGIIDEVRVWNTLRTEAEIADDRSRELNGNESGLVGYWKLNNSLADSTANGNTLSNNGSAVYSTDLPFSGFIEVLKVRKTSDENRFNSISLISDSQLKLSLAANKSYIIDGVVFASSTSSNKDIAIGFFVPTGAEIMLGYTDNKDVSDMVLSSGATSSAIMVIGNSKPTTVHIRGTVKTGASSGDFVLKWAQSSAGTATTSVAKGSYLRAEEI